MIRLGRGEFTHGYHLTTEEIETKVDAVSGEQVQSLARELFATQNLGLCVLGPVDEDAIRWQSGAAVA
jgi:predicted Zn-dependent peptidase